MILEDLALPPAEDRAAEEKKRAARADEKDSQKERPAAKSLPFRVESSPKSKVVLTARDDGPEGAEAEPVEEAQATKAARAPAEEPAPAALSERPSVGAVQAAVGSVMAGARSCLAGQEQGSKAQVTFGPNGRVQSVAVSGPAAGTPAETCLRSALSAARVEPFSDPSFTASLTVRPP
jgi:hypothetical protein